MRRAVATVDLEAVRRNVAGLRERLATGSSLMAVVKANGYGHGAVPVARACLDAGAAALGVATVDEARELRDAGLGARLIVLGPLAGADLPAVFETGAEVLVWSLPFLKNLVLSGHERGADPVRVHVKLDTGMHRLGVLPAKLPELLDALETEPEVALAGLMTHFATADEPDEDFFHFQLRAFEEAVQVVLRTGVKVQFHCANSAAAIRFPQSHFDMVRCGIAVYGLSPFQDDATAHDLTPALRLTSYLADIKLLKEGDSVGYGGTWRAPRDTRIGMVPIGYADGVNRRLSNLGRVLVGGERFPIVGRVSMDLLTIDLGDSAYQPGEEVILIGAQGEDRISAEEVAGLLGTINYEVTCGLSARVERRFSG